MKISEKLQEIRKKMFMKLVSKEKVKSLKEEKLLKGNVIVSVLKYTFLRGFSSKIKTQEDLIYLDGDGKIGSKGLNLCKIIMTIPLTLAIYSLMLSSSYKVLINSLIVIGWFSFASIIVLWIFKTNNNLSIKKTYNENDLEEVYRKMESLSIEDKKDLMGECLNKNYFEEVLKDIMQYVSKDKIMSKLKKIQLNNKDEVIQISNPIIILEILKELIDEEQEKESEKEFEKEFEKILNANKNILNNINNNEECVQTMEKREALTNHA